MRTKVYRSGSLFFLLSLMFFVIQDSFSQYANSGISLQNTMSGSVAWVDIDGDGDLDASAQGIDLFVLGNETGILYFFEGNVPAGNTSLPPLDEGEMKWFDANNDNIPDAVYSGAYLEMMDIDIIVAGIDTFNSVDDNFYNYFSGFTPVAYSSVDWGDYDNDGDFDVLLSGQDAASNIYTTLYINDNNSFTEVEPKLPGITYGKVGFVDYDLDMDLDIFITGQDQNSNKYSRLFKNEMGTFTITQDQFPKLSHSDFDWGDFNNDKYPDLLLGGSDGTNTTGVIFLNKGGNGFVLSDTIVPDFQYGSTGFADVDNDGDLDVFSGGAKDDAAYRAYVIWTNDGSDSLKPTYQIAADYSIVNFMMGDYDKDNDLDFIVNGRIGTGLNCQTQIHDNLTSTGNTKPNIPQNTEANVVGNSVILSWDPSTDNSTPQNALTYNIYVGSSSQGVDIVSPLALVSNGFRKISGQGYIRDTSWLIRDLPNGTYYWGVQAIDNSFASSAFSSEGTFEIKDRFTVVEFNESPNTTHPVTYFDYDHDQDYDVFLTGDDKMIIAENDGNGFNPANYDTVFAQAYHNVKTLSPNDYNNDNRIEFSATGNYTGNPSQDSSIALFGDLSASGYEILENSLVKNADFEYVLWVDLNNDGLQDFVTSGKTTNLGAGDEAVTYVYKNQGDGTFLEMSHSIRGFEDCGAVSADFDNDLDTDLVIYGIDVNGIINTYLYINNGDFIFTEHEIPFTALYRYVRSYGIVAGDFDLNGELDFYMAGRDAQNNNYARVLLNNNLSFTDANYPIRSWTNMSNFWADYDYDGDLDIYSCNMFTSATDGVRLYVNDEQVLGEINVELGDNHQLEYPLKIVNLDNRNGLDLLMKVNDGNYFQFQDNYESHNILTEAPSNLEFNMNELDVILSWDKLPDCPGCTYNIWVGTQTDNVELMSPMADLGTGFRYVVQPGNTYLNNSWKFSGMPVGKYYWSVQAVDQAYTGGPFSPVDSFVVTTINAEFTFDTVCLNDITHFSDLSAATNSVVKWNWNFGDGNTSDLQNPNHKYSTAGTFNARLWAHSASGDSALQVHEILVKSTPISEFTSDIACQGSNTTLTNTTNNNGLTITNWYWEFGDGRTSPAQDPGTHGYTNSGIYNVLLAATANNGCSDTIEHAVTVAENPVAVVASNLPLEFCDGDSTVLSVSYNESYDYTWKRDGAYIAGADSSKLIAKITADYSSEVVNPVGNCSSLSSEVAVTSISIPAAPTIIADGPIQYCEGDSVELSVTFNADYTYQWKLGGGAVGTNSNSLMVKDAGSYSLDVTNSSGCTESAINTLIILVNANPVVPTVSVSDATTFCDGGMVNLSVTNDPTKNYQWYNGLLTVGGATTNSIDADVTGDYKLTITNDITSCVSETLPTSVTVNPTPDTPTISLSGDNEFCDGGSVTLSAADDVSLTYLWKKDGGAVGADQNTHIVTASGDYTLEVSNTFSCAATAGNTATVTVNSLPIVPTVNVGGATTFCDGNSVNLSVTNDGTMNYQWYNGAVTVGGATTNSFDAGVSGDYKLNITNVKGCVIETMPTSVTVNPIPGSPTIIESGPSTFCDVDSVLLSVTNDPALNYQWLLNGGSVGTDTNSHLVKTGGNYTLEVSNASLCAAISNTVAVTVHASPVIPTVGVNGETAFCVGQSVELSVTNNTSVTYQWMDGELNVGGATSNSYTASSTGDYKLSISNGDGCKVETKVVSVIADPAPTAPTIDYTGALEYCDSDSLVLSVVDNPNYTYEWQLNGGTTGSDSSSYTANATGDYTVKVQNLGDCSVMSVNTISLTVHASPETPNINLSGATTFCEGDSVRLSVSDPGADSYQWMSELGEMVGETGTSILVTEAGLYKVERTAGMCESFSQEKQVTVNTYPIIPVIETENYILDACQDEDPVLLSVQTVESGTVYQWSRNGALISGETNNTLIGYLDEGDYTVEANSNTCGVESQTLTVRYGEMPDKPTILAEGPAIWYLACSNDSATAYKWYLNGEIIEGATEYLYVAGTQEGKFEVAISENGGCFVKSDPLWIPLETGIELDIWEHLKIYPNPTPGIFTLEMDNQIMGELIIDIFGESGSKIINIKFYKETEHFKTQVDMSGQPPAAYLIGLMLEKYKTNRTLIVR